MKSDCDSGEQVGQNLDNREHQSIGRAQEIIPPPMVEFSRVSELKEESEAS